MIACANRRLILRPMPRQGKLSSRSLNELGHCKLGKEGKIPLFVIISAKGMKTGAFHEFRIWKLNKILQFSSEYPLS